MDVAAFRSDARHLGLLRAGVRAAYYRARGGTGLRVFRYLYLVPEHLNRELLQRPTRYECRLLESDEVARFALEPDNRLNPAGAARETARGAVCYGILDGTELASFGWYSNAPTSVEGALTVHFDPRYLYMFHGYTKPAYRGEQLHGIGLARALETLCARGWAGFVTLAERVNFTSLVSAHRVGFRDCGTAVAVGRGARMRVWETAAPRRFGLRLSPGVPGSLAPAAGGR